jgi:hypothetical protein
MVTAVIEPVLHANNMKKLNPKIPTQTCDWLPIGWLPAFTCLRINEAAE